MRVHEYAKQLNLSSKEVLQFLSDNNLSVKSHMSVLGDDVILMLDKNFKNEKTKMESQVSNEKDSTNDTDDLFKYDEYVEVKEIFSSCAGAALYKKSLLDELGMFDDNFFAYMEDVDLAIRSQIYGYRNLLDPDAIVYHIGSATSGSRYNEFKVKIAARNNVWTVYKNLPIPLKIINFIFLFFGFLIKYLFFLRKGFGPTYLKGLKEGLNTKSKVNKVNFKKSILKNYFRLEYKLIINTLKFLKKVN